MEDKEIIFNEIVGRAKVGATRLWSSDEQAIVWAQEEIASLRAVLAKAGEMEPTSDRAMLLQLMNAFDTEHSICSKCGHQEQASEMDSAYFLREYLNIHPLPAQAIPERWREMITDLANELESEVMAKYTLETLKYPSQKNKFDSDMDSVHRARALLSSSPKP